MQRTQPLALAGDELEPIHLEADVDADRTHRRAVARAEAIRAADVRHVEICRRRIHVSAVEKTDSLDRRGDVHAQLRVENDDAVAALGKSRWRDRLRITETIQREATHRRVAAGEEALT